MSASEFACVFVCVCMYVCMCVYSYINSLSYRQHPGLQYSLWHSRSYYGPPPPALLSSFTCNVVLSHLQHGYSPTCTMVLFHLHHGTLPPSPWSVPCHPHHGPLPPPPWSPPIPLPVQVAAVLQEAVVTRINILAVESCPSYVVSLAAAPPPCSLWTLNCIKTWTNKHFNLVTFRIQVALGVICFRLVMY